MTNTKRVLALRHFPFQHPLFGRKNQSESGQGVKNSPYYWWWEYLRRSDAYRKTCEAGAIGKNRTLFDDFGDVFSVGFKAWWTTGDHGANLFANSSPNDSVKVLQIGDLVAEKSDLLVIQIPLGLPRKFIEKKIRDILNVNHKGKRGVRRIMVGDAKYKLTRQALPEVLELRLRLYDERLANPKKTLWELGIELMPVFQMEQVTTRGGKPYLDPSLKNEISATVSRHLKEAKKTIKNVEKGIFP